MTRGRPRLSPGESGDPWATQKADGRWQARCRIRDRDGKTREVSALAKTKAAALGQLRKKLADRQDPSGIGAATASKTLDQLAQEWHDKTVPTLASPGVGTRAARSLAPQSFAAYWNAYQNQVSPTFGSLRLSEISPPALTLGLERLAETVSVHQAATVLSQILGRAVREGVFPFNPMRGVELPPRPEGVDALTVGGVRSLRELVRTHESGRATRPGSDGKPVLAGGRRRNNDLGDLLDVLLGSGARISEGLALRWRDVELDRDPPSVLLCGTLVEPRKMQVEGKPVVLVERLHRQPVTKGREHRRVPIPAHLVELLVARRERPRHAADSVGRVFPSASGSWLWPNNLRTRFRSILAAADSGHLEPPESYGDRVTAFSEITPHTLRRSVGTLVAETHGVDAAAVLLGHKTGPAVTRRSYDASTVRQAPDVRKVLSQFFEVSPE